MQNSLTVAVLGSTGYVGLELVKILIKHPNIKITYLGCENLISEDIEEFDKSIKNNYLPKLDFNNNFNPSVSDVVFLALPHGVSHKFVKKFINKIKIIDLSADFRLDSSKVYIKNYNDTHSCPEYLNNFIYGLPEINKKLIKSAKNIAVPGCYPTSILTPLIPLIDNNLIKTNNIIIDSKSGYSGAGKKFDISNIKNDKDYNFYNYQTNEHRHICEVQQELNKFSNNLINFSFNPHILPLYRGMMSTIYCDLENNVNIKNVENILFKFSKDSLFVNILDNNIRSDIFSVQNTNKCLIKILQHNSKRSIIIISIIDNLIKGAAGQAIQCLNIMFNFNEELGLI